MKIWGHLAVGVLGALMSSIYLRLYWRVVSGPGDANPLGMAFLLMALLAVIPGWGLVRLAAGAEFSGLGAWSWLAASVLVLGVGLPFSFAFLK